MYLFKRKTTFVQNEKCICPNYICRGRNPQEACAPGGCWWVEPLGHWVNNRPPWGNTPLPTLHLSSVKKIMKIRSLKTERLCPLQWLIQWFLFGRNQIIPNQQYNQIELKSVHILTNKNLKESIFGCCVYINSYWRRHGVSYNYTRGNQWQTWLMCSLYLLWRA